MTGGGAATGDAESGNATGAIGPGVKLCSDPFKLGSGGGADGKRSCAGG